MSSSASFWRWLIERAASLRFWCAVCIPAVLFDVWMSRYTMNPDGISYLDLAINAAAQGPSQLVSGYWSPAYPGLLAIIFRLLQPSPIYEFPVAHLVNVALFCCLLLCFAMFLRSWLEQAEQSDTDGKFRPVFLLFAFCALLLFTIRFTNLTLITPDLGVAIVLFFVAGIARSRAILKTRFAGPAALGCALASGYYFKAAMFPIALACLGALLIWPPTGLNRRRVATAGLVFIFLSAPLIAILTNRIGHFTIGETGRLNYLWYVDHPELTDEQGWTGYFGDSFEHLTHPPEKLQETSLTLSFYANLRGTYPLWFDPSYWWTGGESRFNLAKQLRATERVIGDYWSFVLELIPFGAGAVALILYMPPKERKRLSWRNLPWEIAWAGAALLLYGFVHVEPRFVGGFFLLLVVAIYGSLAKRVETKYRTIILVVTSCAVIILPARRVLGDAKRYIQSVRAPKTPDDLIIARFLERNGVRQGDRLATVGESFSAFYAHLARIQIAAQVLNADEFRRASASDLDKLFTKLRAFGVRAVVLRQEPPSYHSVQWRGLRLADGSSFELLILGAGNQRGSNITAIP